MQLQHGEEKIQVWLEIIWGRCLFAADRSTNTEARIYDINYLAARSLRLHLQTDADSLGFSEGETIFIVYPDAQIRELVKEVEILELGKLQGLFLEAIL